MIFLSRSCIFEALHRVSKLCEDEPVILVETHSFRKVILRARVTEVVGLPAKLQRLSDHLINFSPTNPICGITIFNALLKQLASL